MVCFCSPDQCRSSYQVGFDNSLRITYANGMDTHYQTEPHILAGAANPTVARRNMSLPGESGQNLVEWRFRKEQARGKVIVFGRKLRVSVFNFSSMCHSKLEMEHVLLINAYSLTNAFPNNYYYISKVSRSDFSWSPGTKSIQEIRLLDKHLSPSFSGCMLMGVPRFLVPFQTHLFFNGCPLPTEVRNLHL